MTGNQNLTIDAALGTLAIAEMLQGGYDPAASRAVESIPQTFLVAGFALTVQTLVGLLAEATNKTSEQVYEDVRSRMVDLSIEGS